MIYTPPAYNSANVSWSGSLAYSPPTANAANVSWSTSSFIVSESGIDTIAIDGVVIIQGNLSVSEQSADIFFATSYYSEGTLLAIEDGLDIVIFSGDVIVQGDSPLLEDVSDTFSAIGYIPIIGDLQSIEDADIMASIGEVLVQGNVSFTELTPDTLTFAGQVLVQGNFAVSEVEIDRFLTTANGTRVGSMHHMEDEGDTITISGDVDESTVVRHLYYKVAFSTDFGGNFTQLIYLDEAEAPNPPSSLVPLPTETPAPTLPPDPTDEDVINAVKGETLLKWYKTDIDLAFESQFHPYDSVVTGQTSPDGYIPEDTGTSTGGGSVAGLTGLTESTRDVFSASGSSSNYVKPVIIEIRDYVTDLPITSVAVTLAVDGVNKTVTNGVAYLGTVATGSHTVLASATGYHATNADTIANDSFTL